MIRHHWPDVLIACIIFALCLAVYTATLTPSLSYKSPDGNELATVCYILGLAHSTGYPLYTWLGKLFTFIPIGDVAHRVNLMSGVLGAASVVLLYIILRILTSDMTNLEHRASSAGTRTSSRLTSTFTALLFAFSRSFWSQTGIAEVYAPNAFAVTLTLVILLCWARVEERDRSSLPTGRARWHTFLPSWRSVWLLFTFGLCFGLSLGVHMSDLGFGPAFALFILLVSWRTAINPASLVSMGSGFSLGLLQFLWLPYKASTLTDRAMRANAPTTLRGIYNYTLGAFPQFKFAFPLAAIPDRIVIYLDFVRQQFGLWGIGLGVLGMWTLLVRKPKRFFLIFGMYLTHVWFFIQYRVFDLDVFFIPAHLLYAVFIGYGVYWLIEQLFAIVGMGREGPGSARRVVLPVALLVMLALPIGGELRANWEANDYSHDTAINDFYENVFDLMPQEAAILGRSGVFGYDMFYYRLVYDVRPDVLMPHLPHANPHPENLLGREVYTTILLDGPEAGRGPWALPRGLVNADAWHVPVLFGNPDQAGSGPGIRPLTLYHVTSKAPKLFVADADPQVEVGEVAAGWMLVGYDLENHEVIAGDTLHLTLYWRATRAPQQVLMSTMLDGLTLEIHEPGMGNLRRYIEGFHPPRDGILVEDYRVVVPRTIEAGTVELAVGVGPPFRFPGNQAEWEALDLGDITILPLEEEKDMTTEHKYLIVAGGILILGVLLIAAFALGVYVGEHGWTRAGLALQGPGGGPGGPLPPPGVPDVPGPPLAAPPGGGRPPDLVGRIGDIFEGALMLATPDGARIIELDEHTRVETTEGEPRPLNGLERGQHVAVFGRRNGDGQVLVAELLVLLPPPEGPPADQPPLERP